MDLSCFSGFWKILILEELKKFLTDSIVVCSDDTYK